jgi:hypothetical protein
VAHLDQHPVAPALLAALFAVIGQYDEAFHWLETGWSVRDPFMIRLGNVVEFEPLHADPRWTDIMQRIRAAGPPLEPSLTRQLQG